MLLAVLEVFGSFKCLRILWNVFKAFLLLWSNEDIVDGLNDEMRREKWKENLFSSDPREKAQLFIK